jgi:hypothetical protein
VLQQIRHCSALIDDAAIYECWILTLMAWAGSTKAETSFQRRNAIKRRAAGFIMSLPDTQA